MQSLRNQVRSSPILIRALPYVLLVVLTVLQDMLFSGAMRYWIYFIKMLLGLWCIREMYSLVPEMRWAFSWEAIVAGVLVFVLWVGLDPYYPKNEIFFKAGAPWNPFAEFGEGTSAAWFFVGVRTLGSALIVPPIEEACFRSFLYRYFVREQFTTLALNHFHRWSFVVTAVIFGLVHYQWLPGILCGMIYQALVLRKNRLGDAMTAHAITNFLLGIWVVWKGAWIFW